MAPIVSSGEILLSVLLAVYVRAPEKIPVSFWSERQRKKFVMGADEKAQIGRDKPSMWQRRPGCTR